MSISQVVHCNLRPPEPRQPFAALITTPCQVWYGRTYPLPYYSVFCCWYITLRCDLDLWPVTLTFDFFGLEYVQRIACDVMKLCTKFERNRTIRGGVIAISVFDLMTLNVFQVLRSTLDNFHQVWPSTTYPCLNYSVFMLIPYVMLWPWPLSRWPRKFVIHQASRDQNMYKIWAKSSNDWWNWANYW